MIGSVTTIDGQAYSALTAYDDLGRAWRSQDASSAWLKTEFDARGYAVRLCDSSVGDSSRTCASGSPSTWRETLETDARGNVLAERRGGTDALLLTRFFEASTGRLLDQCAGINCGLLDESYTWDSAGNLSARDKAGQYSETFSYDPLNRLIGTQTSRPDGLGGSMVVASTAQTYDKLGNICSKTIAGQVQDYTYAGPSGCGINVAAGSGGDYGSPHAVTQANGGSFNYDQHGNQTQASYSDLSKNRKIAYTAADQASQISMGDEFAPSLRTRFWYGSDGSRYKREDDTPSSTTKRTLYVGNLEIVSQGGITTYKRYVAGVMVQDVTGSTVTNQFLFHDHIGSVIRAVSASGAVIEGMDYGAFGERRGYTDPTLPAAVPQTTTRGFTGHEMIDGTDVVHMNGRIYDSKLGRFLQADPVIQEPNNPQNFNRYTYVLNNPLSLTDPSGYSFLGKLGKFIRPLAAIAITYYTGGLAAAATGWASVGWTVAGGFAAGVVSSGTLKGGLIGAFTAVAFLGAGKLATSVQANTFGRAALHGLAGGVLSSVQGGSFGHGFVQAGLSKAASAYGPSFGNDYADGVLAAIEGGTISELTGGKFINGVQTAAMQFAYNSLVQLAADAIEESNENSPRNGDIIVGFDGAGSSALPDNQAIAALATDGGAKLFDAKAIIGAPVGDAKEFILSGLAENPGARVFIFGYSAGGDAAICLARALDRLGVPVAGLVTFDPHPAAKLFGAPSFTLPRNVKFALNIFQQNPVTTNFFGIPKFPNPFLGGPVICSGCANIDLTGTSAVHTNIVGIARGSYGAQIRKTLGR